MYAHICFIVAWTSLVSIGDASPVSAATVCHSSVLSSPTPLTSFKNGVATKHYTQSFEREIELPFKVGVFPRYRKHVNISESGLAISDLDNPYSAFQYWNVYQVSSFVITKGQKQGVFSSVEGKVPNRTANIEWRLGSKMHRDLTWHFGLQWYEADKNFIRFKYWNIPIQIPQPPRLTEVDYYRADNIIHAMKAYYGGEATVDIKTGDVLMLRDYDGSGGGGGESQLRLGSSDACQYEKGTAEFSEEDEEFRRSGI